MPSLNNVKVKNEIWKNFFKIVTDIKSNSIDSIKDKTFTWLNNFLETSDLVTPYVHIFCSHLHTQNEYISGQGLFLNDFSMQGLEKSNDFLTKYYQRSTNKKNKSIKQLLQKRNRIEILTYQKDLSFLI